MERIVTQAFRTGCGGSNGGDNCGMEAFVKMCAEKLQKGWAD